MRRNGRFSARVLAVAVVAGTVLLATPSLGAQPAWAATSQEPDQERHRRQGVRRRGRGRARPELDRDDRSELHGDRVRGRAAAVPTPTSPGPKHRGANFFAGGPNDTSNTIVAAADGEAAPYATAIAGGQVGFTLDGYLGGYYTQEDTASVEVDFKDKHGGVVGTATIGPVSASDRG